MKKFIYKLREQPEAVRKNILHITTVAFAIILFLLWVYSLGVGFSNPDTQTNIQNDLKPLNNLKSDLLDSYDSTEGEGVNLGQ